MEGFENKMLAVMLLTMAFIGLCVFIYQMDSSKNHTPAKGPCNAAARSVVV